MTYKKVHKIEEKDLEVVLEKFKGKKYNPMYYYPNRLLSYDPKKYFFYIAIGSRGRGKTVSAWRWVLKRFLKHGELFVWLRLTEAPIKKAARNQGTTLVPKFLLNQLGIVSITMKGTVLYATLNDEEGRRVMKMIGVMDGISTFYSTKGNDLSLYTNIVFDEINRETTERNTFDVTRAFINQIENIARMRTLRCLMLGNTIDDTSEILGLFNFQPKEFGIYRLTRRGAIVEYLDDSEEFKEARKNSLAGKLLGDNKEISSSFTNKTTTFRDNVIKFSPTRHKQIFRYYVGELRDFGVYETKATAKGDKGTSKALFVGEVRDTKQNSYKISPFMNCEGIYNKDIYEMFYELISTNSIEFETTLIRSRFVKALKSNRTALR